MTTVDSNKNIQRIRTELEMRMALNDFISQKYSLRIPPQVEDADMVLHDVISELLEARKKLAILEPLRDALISEHAWEETLRDPGGPEKVLEPVIIPLKPVKTPIHDALKDTAVTTGEDAEKAANAELEPYTDPSDISYQDIGIPGYKAPVHNAVLRLRPVSQQAWQEELREVIREHDRLMLTGNPCTYNPGTAMQTMESNKENVEVAKEALYFIGLDDGYHGVESMEVLQEEQEG